MLRRYIPDLYRSNIDTILDSLSKEGFITQYYESSDEDFCAQELQYSWGLQPALDYLIARKMYSAIKSGKNITIIEESGKFQMLALIVAEENGKLLSDFDNVVINEDLLFSLSCYMLANASVSTAEIFKNYINNVMKMSVDRFRYVVNRVIIPTSCIENHPVGAMLLDSFLRSFLSSSERDIWWSIPAFLRDNGGANWYSTVNIDYEYIELGSDDNVFAKPLVLSWCLSSVDNEIRRLTRLKLLKWGMRNPLSFYELLLYISDVNDEQILEDMFSIAYSIAFEQNPNEEYLVLMSTWIMDNIFSKEGLIQYENSFVRHFCSGIIKIAASKGSVDSALINYTNPPFSSKNHFMGIEPEAIKANRMGGFLAIDYDLARYVLCDVLDIFFERNLVTKAYSKETEAFIELYKNKYELNEITIDGLIISIAYHYMKCQGWDVSVFWHYSDNYHGVDNAIMCTYHPADHGAMSSVMTVAEKYVWISRHKMEAYFANILPYDNRRYTDNAVFINNYALIESFTNVFQEYTNGVNRSKIEKWFHIDELTNTESNSINLEAIEEWMQTDQVPNFKEWIFNNEDSILLSSFTNSINDFAGIEEAVWISSGIVKQQCFNVFIENINACL